jgi:acetyl-CoA carboxylase, biotin carboxylase subunit
VAEFHRILIANRGEIAVRVMRTCRELGIATVAVYSEADRSGLHVRLADQAYCVGPAPARESYLAQDRILEAARRAKVDAIHPGYGFLSENASFVRACERAGITFIGPPASAMEAMGEKTRARANMIRAGVPVVPGGSQPLTNIEEARTRAQRLGYPVMLKAAGGGGGKGMRQVQKPEELESAWRATRSEALTSFGNDAVYLEKALERPRHVEIQIFADSHGSVIHLNERECSVQRRHQKVIEETPSPALNPALRESMGQVAIRAARAVGYVGAGTVEFLMDAQRNFYFLEMNTRLQVEHPITEWVTGLDLVAWQIAVAQGGRLPYGRALSPRGHAIEVRVYAEDPAHDFLPSPGKILSLRTPGGPWLRDDSGVYAGYTVPSHYDPMIGKLSVWGPNRREAISRMRRCLDEYVVKGITTNLTYLRAILEHSEFIEGSYDTTLLTRAHQLLLRNWDSRWETVAVVASVLRAHQTDVDRARSLGAPASAARGPSPWRLALKERRQRARFGD